ncbi:hypothetical protein RA210_U140078 [Rubrivivax sp. A210]|uniref:TIR domain-containing protein n=1 Tax=Rubrivivax sp. A210 TaxID=2772301 RepID=UPI00191A2964|nr:TIR domain-containing protein [Rubrivivax sp. A210]CAD5371119.1 hypothetical protein RA210_U140078 [Rubrivivax sp. A210]
MVADKPHGAKRSLASRLFGYDVFVSFALGPPPRGSRAYAADLARRLRELDLAVFFSEEEAPAGGQLDATLKGALRRSRTLVVVLNPATVSEPRWVRAEVEEFRRARTGGLVVPISIGGALTDPALAAEAESWLAHRHIIWIDETEAAWQEGVVGEDVLRRLVTAPHSVRSATRWRALVSVAMATFATLALVAWLQRQAAVVSEANAVRNARAAEDSASAARVAEAQASQAARDEAAAAARAESAASAARTAEALATREAEAARKAEARAREELVRATALRLAAESDAMLAGLRAGGDRRALLQLVAAARLAPEPEVLGVLHGALQRHSDLVRLIELPTAGTQVALDEAGGRLFVAVPSHGVQVFTWPGGRPLPGLSLARGTLVRALALSDDGSRLALVIKDGIARERPAQARVWDTGSWQAIGPVLDAGRDGTAAAAFGTDGTTLWLAVDELLLHHELTEGQLLSRHVLDIRTPYPEGKMTLSSLHISVAQGRVVGGGFYGPSRRALVLWRLPDAELVASTLLEERCDTQVVGLAPDGRRVLTAGGYVDFDNSMCSFDSAGLRRLSGPAKPMRHPVSALAGTADGRFYAIGTEGGDIASFNVALDPAMPQVLAREPHRGGVRAIVAARGSDLIASVAEDATVRLQRWLKLGEGLATSPERTTDVVGQIRFDWGGTLHLGDAGGGQSVDYLLDPRNGLPGGLKARGDAGFAACVAFLPGGQRLFALRRGRVVQWDRATGREAGAPLAEAPQNLSCLTLDPEGRRLAAGTQDGKLMLWDVASGRRIWTSADRHQKAVGVLRFSADGRQLYSGGADGLIAVTDTGSGREARPPLRAGAGVVGLDVDPVGDFLASSHGTTVRWWHLPSGRPVGAPFADPMSEGLGPLVFSADGRRVQIYARGRYGVRIWPAPGQWAAELCARLTQDITPAEWRDWIAAELPYRALCP